MQIFLRHLYAGVSEKRGYCLYVGSGIQKIYGETVPGAVPCDALLYSGVLHPSGEMFSRRTLVGQIEYSLPRVVIILRLSYQFISSSLSGVTTAACALRPALFFWLNLITMLS